MTLARLLLRSLVYHRRGNLAVLLGVVVGAAVLTGALLVGDSLLGSLRDLTLERLGWVDRALVAPRFFREELAGGLKADRLSPALLLQGSADQQGAVLYGVDERFWPADQLPMGMAFWHPAPSLGPEGRPVVVGAALARDLGLHVGGRMSFHLQKASGAPRETVLGRRKSEDVLADLTLTVAAVLPDGHFGSRFSLSPGSAEPRNAFVPLSVLQAELHRQERNLPRDPVNAVFAGAGKADELKRELRAGLTLEDLGLVLRVPRRRAGQPAPGYVSLESRQLFLGEPALRATREAGLTAAPTLVYLVNNIARMNRQAATVRELLAPPGPVPFALPAEAYYGPLEVPYSIVAALDPALPPPLGPFLPKDMKKLEDDQILLAEWQGSPLKGARPGDVLTLTYFAPQEEGRLRERTAAFRLAAVIPIQGAANDPNLTPQFPGITDRLTIGEWDPPFPYDPSRIRPADEAYWTKYRTTPKAYITPAAGQKLWASRFGRYTSLRIAPGELSTQEIGRRILAHMSPEEAGLVFRDVRATGLEASAGSSDFGPLFLGFSSFLIVAALLLVGLLFRLNLDRRASEVGLLLATGYRRGTVRRLLLLEGGLLALVGAALGCAAAVGYAWLMLELLGVLWPGGLDRSFLRLHVTALSFAVGYAASVAVSVLTIFWATRMLARVPPSALLAGTTTVAPESAWVRRPRWSLWLAAAAALLAVGCLVWGAQATDQEERAGGFFGSGFLLLLALLALVWAWLRGTRRRHEAAAGSLAALGVRNAGRHALRSVLTVGLLASATFLVVAVQAFHRDPGADFLARGGGSGGFPLLAESDLPVYEDLNTARGRENLELPPPAVDALRQATVIPLRLSAGDDASCLNLYRPLQPRLLGVPDALIERGGFRFSATEADTAEEEHNPWLLLRKRWPGGAVPVFGETNTVTWILKKGLGQEVKVKDGDGNPVRLRIVGLLEDSVFQSELVASEQDFLALYPRQEGYRMFLIDAPPADADKLKAALQPALAPYGFRVMPAAERLASYLAVENTYLATFQALGGLGVLLGALGLAVVLLRGVWERRGELALLRAVGFRRSALGWLVLAENACLLLLGLGVGTLAALVAVAPHLTGGVAGVLWLRLLALLGLVLAVGLAAGAAAVLGTLRAPLLPALRQE